MSEPTVLLAIRDDVAEITLNRPQQRNALSLQMREELARAITQVLDDVAVRAVILSGAQEAFCSGGYLAQMLDPTQNGLVWRDRIRRLHRGFSELANFEKPFIAAVDGPAYGAGLSLALAFDFVLATPRALFCVVFGRVGLIPDLGAMQPLPRIVGQQRAKELVFSARRFDAAEANALGIFYRIVPKAGLMEEARTLANRFTKASTAAIGMAKSIMNQAFHLDAHAMAEFEAYAQTVCRSTAYNQEAVDRFKTKQLSRFYWERE